MAIAVIDIRRNLEFWASVKPHELAFFDGKKEITFAGLQDHTLKIATTLRSLGVRDGDLVCTILPPYLDWPVTLALQIIGAVSFSKPANSNFDSCVEPKWLISATEQPKFSTGNTILVNQDFAEKVNSADTTEKIEIEHDPNKIFRLSSTSGTSGEVKYLSFTQNEMRPRVENQRPTDFLGNRRFLNLFPSSASASFNWALRSLVLGKTYFTASPKDEIVKSIILGKNVKTVIGSPNQISRFLTTLEIMKIKLDSSHNIIMGGSTPSARLLNRIRNEHQAAIYNSHGSAETGFISICDVTTENSPGLVIYPNSIVEVLDERGLLIDSEEVGILRYKTLYASNSYFNNPTATKEYFKDGYFYSGDMGYKTKDGRLFITGRSNEVINLGGVKINPEQVDEIAGTQDGVLDVAAFAIEDESGIPKLAIALVIDSEFDEENFRENMKFKFQSAKVEKIFKVEAIPRNPNGKILRRVLNQKFGNLG